MLDANIVLSDRAAITSSQISIKPDLTKEECEVENVLERRALINNGIEHKNTKMRGNTLYVNKKPYGFVQNFKFYKSAASDPDIQMDSAYPTTLLLHACTKFQALIHAHQ